MSGAGSRDDPSEAAWNWQAHRPESGVHDEAFAFLEQRGWTQVKIDCWRVSPADLVGRILKRLDAVAT